MRALFYSLLMLFPLLSLCQPLLQVVTELSPPNQTRINNEVAGHSTDIVKRILAEAELDASFSIYPWARAYKLASKFDNTLIYSLARTPEREMLFHWVGPVAQFKLGFVKLSERRDIEITSIAEAKKYKVAVQRHDLAFQVLSKHGFDLLITSDIRKSYHLLLAKKVDLIIDDKNYLPAMGEQLAIDHGKLSFIYAIDELAVFGYLAANINTEAKIVGALKSAFNEVKKTSEYKTLIKNR
ncbi:substrate-binding periplasmic protein [Pseudoalteromonas sp. H105]|uniref:substrate-binding periplasmic protein n=1 Tax=Pseudoalteromonas sp. H105 TaxID=1348393 RepID=UPI0007322E31|nr:transporter substrate-binding domain-containing protein [Pseudoalteromonas sp. H105]KTF16951.1 amino acid ABC transporter substrate-binding protein [Pseudoalteromonas sp. H105]